MNSSSDAPSKTSPTSQALDDLLARVERTGPDRELDGRIMFALFAKPAGENGYLWPEDNPSWSFAIRLHIDPFKARAKYDGETIAWPLPEEGGWLLMNTLRVPKLTASIDAALALVELCLPGWLWAIAAMPSGQYHAWLRLHDERGKIAGANEALAATAPLAILAALLKTLKANPDG